MDKGNIKTDPSENDGYQGKEISASGLELIKKARTLFREGRHAEAEIIAYQCCRQEETGMIIGLLIGAFDDPEEGYQVQGD